MPRAAMVLAAGFGTRMGRLTQDRPKALIEVGGRPLIDHALAAAGPANPIVTNGHYRADQLRTYLTDRHPNAHFSEETPDILDSGGAIKQALPLLGAEPVLTLNADAVWRGPPPASILDAAWDGTQMEALLLLVPFKRAIGRQGGGDFAKSPDGRLTLDKSPGTWVYTGAQILRTDRIADRPDAVFSLLEIWQEMMAAGTLFGCVYPGHWADVGHPAGVAEAEAMVADAV